MPNKNQPLNHQLIQALDLCLKLASTITPLLQGKTPSRDHWQHESSLSQSAPIQRVNFGRCQGPETRTNTITGNITVALAGSRGGAT